MKFRPGDKVYYINSDGERVFREVAKEVGGKVWFTEGTWMELEECFLVTKKKKGFAQWASNML